MFGYFFSVRKAIDKDLSPMICHCFIIPSHIKLPFLFITNDYVMICYYCATPRPPTSSLSTLPNLLFFILNRFGNDFTVF